MAINYKKELESASKGMILIHDPRTLIRLIVRMIVRKVGVRHAAMILYDHVRDAYVLTISRGEAGIKIPAGFARFDKDSPLIKFFDEINPTGLRAVLLEDLHKMLWQESVVDSGPGRKHLLHEVIEQLQLFNAVACVPAYFQKKLLAVLMLGQKDDDKRFDEEELDFFSALASDAAMAIRNAQLFNDLKREAELNRSLFIRTTIALASAIEAKDKYTRGHTERVTSYSLAIARQMQNSGAMAFPARFFEDLQIGGLLHDIGKIGIPESILSKTEKLTVEEFDIMKQHTLMGVEILKPLTELQEPLKGVRSHHERYDGKGYPDGLKGEEIPIIAAIIAVADTFDAMTTDRPYRKGLSRQVAMEEIRRNVGVQFHPLAARAFLDLYERERI